MCTHILRVKCDRLRVKCVGAGINLCYVIADNVACLEIYKFGCNIHTQIQLKRFQPIRGIIYICAIAMTILFCECAHFVLLEQIKTKHDILCILYGRLSVLFIMCLQ